MSCVVGWCGRAAAPLPTVLIAAMINSVQTELPSEELAEQQYADGLAAFRRGDNEDSRRLSLAAIETAAAVGSVRGQALGHIGLARADFRDQDYASGLAHALTADGFAQACGAADLQVTALHMRAELTRARGDYAEALPLYRDLLAADEASGDDGSLAMEHYNLGSVLLQTGDLEGAELHLRRSLALCPAKDGLLGYTLLGLGGLLARTGDPVDAGRVLGAAEAHFAAIGEVLDPAEALELASHVESGKARDPKGYEAGRSSGRALSLEQALDLIRR